MSTRRVRVDAALVQRGLAESADAARVLIDEGVVLANGSVVMTHSRQVAPSDELLVKPVDQFVSRGGIKLEAALAAFNIDVSNLRALDAGASTGGFSEVLLTKNCTRVYCVDEGTNQLHPRIKENHKIVDLQQTHVRELTSNLIPQLVDLIVIDVSFISLEKVLPFLHPFIKPNGKVIALVKPQFEAGKENVPKTGIIKDAKIHLEVVENVKKYALMSNFNYLEHIDSPELGSDGNKEFLMLLEK